MYTMYCHFNWAFLSLTPPSCLFFLVYLVFNNKISFFPPSVFLKHLILKQMFFPPLPRWWTCRWIRRWSLRTTFVSRPTSSGESSDWWRRWSRWSWTGTSCEMDTFVCCCFFFHVVLVLTVVSLRMRDGKGRVKSIPYPQKYVVCICVEERGQKSEEKFPCRNAMPRHSFACQCFCDEGFYRT